MLRQKPVLEPKWNMIREWGVLWRLKTFTHEAELFVSVHDLLEIAYFKHRCYYEPNDLLQNLAFCL